MLFPQNKGSETKYASNKSCVLSVREGSVQVLLGEEQHLLYVLFYDLFNK